MDFNKKNNKEKGENTWREKINAAFQPVYKVLSPAIDKWNQWVSPLSKSWRAYKTKYPRETKILIWITRLIFIGILALSIFVLLVAFGVFGHLPTTDELKQIETANASEVYSVDGKLIGKFYTENRTTIELDSISPYLVTALLAIEDKRFFEHSGIDLRSWMRVFKGIATNNSALGGGSTLSQQLAKNLYPRKRYRIPMLGLFINKVKENLISIKLEKIYNKEELLIMYLNTVPFGGNRYGIQEAARYFYGKRPSKLNAAESATLIGMLKATTALDPTRNPKNSQARRNLVLSQMLKNKDFRFESKEMATISAMINSGAINEEDYNIFIEKPVNASVHEDIGSNDGIGTYFREYLRTKELPRILKNLNKEDGNAYNLYTDGLKIYTTLDSRMQAHADASVYKHMSYIQKEFYNHWKGVKNEKPWGDDKWIDDQVKRSNRYQALVAQGIPENQIDSIFNVPAPMTIFAWHNKPIEKDTMLSPLDSVRYYFTLLNTGFMAMNHSNGYIQAWVGGIDFLHFKYDHILSRRQVGSTFKPIVYTAALEEGIKPCTFIGNHQVTIQDWSPKNADGTYGGYYTMTGGLAFSSNVIAAQLIEKVGIQKTLDMAAKLGVTATLPREFGISLGAAEVSLYDMMKVYATLANGGQKINPVAILKIEDRYGNVIYDYEKTIENDTKIHVIDSTTAYQISRMLQSVINSGTGNALRSQYCQHCEFGGKTGTTNNHSDGWFIGYNPEIVTGAWVGGMSPAVRFRSMTYGSGAKLALPIVGQFWYSLSIDKAFAPITQKKFKSIPKINEEMICPLRIGFSPDMYYEIMRDSTVKDSLIRTGFRSLKEIAIERYPEAFEEELEALDGEGNPILDEKAHIPKDEGLKQKAVEQLTDEKVKDKPKKEDKNKDPDKTKPDKK